MGPSRHFVHFSIKLAFAGIIGVALLPLILSLAASGPEGKPGSLWRGLAAAAGRGGPAFLLDPVMTPALGGAEDATGSSGGAAPDSTSFSVTTTAFVDIPSIETVVDSLDPTPIPADDRAGRAFSLGNGQVCVLEMEEFNLQALVSFDGGRTFTPPRDVPSSATQTAVWSWSGRMSNDGRLYVATAAVDPHGDFGLRFTRSDDGGQTWVKSKGLVVAGDPSYGVRAPVVAAGSSGFASILYRGSRGYDPWVISTSDFGLTWRPPVRVDAGIATATAQVEDLDIAIGAGDTIFAVYSQSRSVIPTATAVYRTRSSNGGLSFEPEASFDSAVPSHGRSARPRVKVAADGSVLVAFWDSGAASATDDHVYVHRSANQGQSYSLTHDAVYTPDTNVDFPLDIAVSSLTATALLLTADDHGRLMSRRSANNGQTFAAPVVLATTSSTGFPPLGRPSPEIAWSRVGNSWAVAWTDDRSDPYARARTDVYLRITPTDGLSWLPEARVDGDPLGAARSFVESVVQADPGNLFVLYEDGRLANGRSFDEFGNRSSISPVSFGPDWRADADSLTVTARVSFDPHLVTDGVDNVYVVSSVVDAGPFPSIRLARYGNGGTPPSVTVTAIGDSARGSRIEFDPVAAAEPAGVVHVVWLSLAPNGSIEIRANSSTDFGASFLPTDRILSGPGVCTCTAVFDGTWRPSIGMGLPGEVHVAWTDGHDVYLSTSRDSGFSYATQIVDQNNTGANDAPSLSVAGSQVLVVWRSPDLTMTSSSIWAVVSHDGGLSWEPRVELRPDGLGGDVTPPELARGGPGGVTTTATVFWGDLRAGGTHELHSSHWDTVGWSPDTTIAAPPGVDLLRPSPVPVTQTAQLVAFEDSRGGVYVARSTDGGLTFPTYARLDLEAPDPSARSSQPLAVADGQGNAWVAWLDESAGLPEVAVVHSGDGGATFSPVVRLSRGLPQGTSLKGWTPRQVSAGALPRVAFFPWAAAGASNMPDAVFNAYDLDDHDRDGVPALLDCSDNDPGAYGFPDVVSGVSVTASLQFGWLATEDWLSQASTAGPGTTYDIASGSLMQLRATGGFGGAVCLASGLKDSTYRDTRQAPPPEDGYYELVRARNSCGIGSWGDSSIVPDPRDQLDSTSGPCQ